MRSQLFMNVPRLRWAFEKGLTPARTSSHLAGLVIVKEGEGVVVFWAWALAHERKSSTLGSRTRPAGSSGGSLMISQGRLQRSNQAGLLVRV
jgi:hypothetical protein